MKLLTTVALATLMIPDAASAQFVRSGDFAVTAGEQGSEPIVSLRFRAFPTTWIGGEGYFGMMFGSEPVSCAGFCGRPSERTSLFLLIGPTVELRSGRFAGYAGLSGGADLNETIGYWTWQLGLKLVVWRSLAVVVEDRWFADTGGAQEPVLSAGVSWKFR